MSNRTNGSDEHRLPYGDTVIKYKLRYAKRKTLGISVHPDLTVTVAAPHGLAFDAIESTVRRRAPWILRQQRELDRYLPHQPPRRYVSGETHRYLGRQYRLKVEDADGGRERVKLVGGYLHVLTRDRQESEHVKTLVEGWYRRQARRVFAERLAAVMPRFAQFNLSVPELRIRRMKSRWGSCTRAGKITLNLRLMQVAKAEIDYVIVHELCHLVEHNHSRRYYALLDRMLPDWREHRQRLNVAEVG